MTNIKYLKENNLLSAHEHFMKLSESYVPNFPEEEVDEADGQGAQDPNSMGSDPNAMGGDPSTMGGDMSQDPSMVGDPSQDPNAMGDDPNMGGDMSQDPSEIGADPSTMGGDTPQDLSSMGSDPSAMNGDESEGQDDDGDTIDIDGLTRAQDKLNVKQNHVGRDLSKVDTKIKTLIDTIQN